MKKRREGEFYKYRNSYLGKNKFDIARSISAIAYRN